MKLQNGFAGMAALSIVLPCLELPPGYVVLAVLMGLGVGYLAAKELEHEDR